jgi:hypothetical protein
MPTTTTPAKVGTPKRKAVEKREQRAAEIEYSLNRACAYSMATRVASDIDDASAITLTISGSTYKFVVAQMLSVVTQMHDATASRRNIQARDDLDAAERMIEELFSVLSPEAIAKWNARVESFLKESD